MVQIVSNVCPFFSSTVPMLLCVVAVTRSLQNAVPGVFSTGTNIKLAYSLTQRGPTTFDLRATLQNMIIRGPLPIN